MATKKYTSLRTLFLRWLLLFSVIPLIFVAGIFSYQFKNAVQDEIFERLLVYTKQIQDLFSEYETYATDRLNDVVSDNEILYYLKTQSIDQLQSSLQRFVESDLPSAYVVYDQNGNELVRVSSSEKAKVGPKTLSAALRERLEDKDRQAYAYFFSVNKQMYLNLSVVKKLKDDSLKWQGYIEKIILLDEEIVKQIKTRFGLDVIFFGPKGEIFLSSIPEEELQGQASQDFLKGNNHFFDLNVQGSTFGFISTAVSWGSRDFLIAIGAMKTNLTRGVSQLMYIFLGAIVLLLLCLALFSYLFTHQVIRPLGQLVQSMKAMQEYNEPIVIEHKTNTEIGLLADNFNDLSQKVYDYQNDLQKQVVALEKANVDVQQAQNQLIQSAKLASIGQLVAGVAHELNNPIGFIYSNMQHLREYTTSLIGVIEDLSKKSNDGDKIKKKYDYDFISKDLPKLIASCEEGARRTRDIVNGLRTFSRSSDKDQKKFSVTDCLDSTLDLLVGASKKSVVQLNKSYADFVPLMEGNPNQISQVFMNILSNAYQAVGDNGKVQIVVSYIDEKDQIIVKIKDNGSGITPENLGKIFDPFFTTKDVGQGTGLGLSISYGIIKSHGGDILVNSQVGKGTEFTIQLPAKSKDSSKSES
ncbi:MAG: HAMP domain-containing protein [Bdellovibrionales bacterium]|nr:HAMP domain-containing protein [Bdellovibrionales bacterium]